MSSKPDVVIIGGGASGCSIAYHLAKEGVPSQIVERDAVASRASGKAVAIISSPSAVLFIEEAMGGLRPALSILGGGYERFQQLAPELKEEGGVDIEYGELPFLCIAEDESEEKAFKEQVAKIKKDAFEISWLEADDVKARFPDIRPEIRGAVLTPGSQIEPYKYVLALLQAAEAKGASMKQGEAVGFRYQGSRVTAIVLATGEIRADVVVVAMGPWSAKSVSWLGKKLPLRIILEQCLRVEVPERLPPMPFSVANRQLSLRSMVQ